ncbi:MAG: low molecular weight protein-tyrosine-phosphatase [Pseudomonadota bacterium]
MAHGFFQNLIEQENLQQRITCDSAGLIDFHKGNPPDSRARKKMRERGIDIGSQRSRPINVGDLNDFDHLIAMDRGHFDAVEQMLRRENSSTAKLSMMMDFTDNPPTVEVPDPYYGDYSGFEEVARLLEPAIRGLLHSLKAQT